MLKDFLKLVVEKEGSHLYFSPGSMPSMKLNSGLIRLGSKVLTAADTDEISSQIMNDAQVAAFAKNAEIDLVVDMPRLGRFSVNVFKQRNQTAMVFRRVKTKIADCKELDIPKPLRSLVLNDQGLILLCGNTSEEKMATLAALVDHRNSNKAGHIVTIEEPISYVHEHKQSIVNQREVGVDTACYADALNNAMRQEPDMLVIGDVRDRETMQYALSFAQSGNLCIACLPTDSPEQAIERIVRFYPADQHEQLRSELSLNTLALVSQGSSSNSNSSSSIELLMASPLVKDLIRQGESHKIEKVVNATLRSGTKSFDSILHTLFENRQTQEALVAKRPSSTAIHRSKTDAPTDRTTDRSVSAFSPENDLGWAVEPLQEESKRKTEKKRIA